MLGNHDLFRTAEYLPYFENVRGSWPLDEFILTHIPIHVDSIERWKGNVHGHLHSKRVMCEKYVFEYDGYGRPIGKMQTLVDPRYLCVSVEHTDYTPISLDEVNKRFKEQNT